MNKISYHIPIIIVSGVAMVAIFALWQYTNGYPFIYQNDESFLSYIHAWYMNFTNPFEFSFLTRQEPGKVYTHNPNMPRYLHYLLMKIGVIDFTYQLLIISITGTVATIQILYASLYKKLQDMPLALSSLIFLLITPQFVFFSHNTYRVVAFLLFALMLYATSNNRRILLFLSTFLLFQYEYAFALFLAVTFFSYLIFDGINKNKIAAMYMVAGAIISGVVFLIQLISHLSFQQLMREIFEVVLPIRSSANRDLIEVIGVFKGILNKQHSYFWSLYTISLATGAIIFAWSKQNILRRFDKRIDFSTKLLFATFLGGIFVTLVLPEYCSDAYGDYRFPFTCFHEFVIFLFIITVFFALGQFIFKQNYTFIIRFFLIGVISAYPLFILIKSNLQYVNFKSINRGEYLDIFKAYENKHYISNFWAGHMPNNTPRPLYPELAYGAESIYKAIVEYKERNSINPRDSIFYICVRQPSYNCKDMITQLHNKWKAPIVIEKQDYYIIEFTPTILTQMTRAGLGITEEHWIYLALNFMDLNKFETSIKSLNLEHFDNISQSIYDSDLNALNLLHAFRKINNIISTNAYNLNAIPNETIKYLQMRHPITWKPAMLAAIAKFKSEADGRKFCNKDDIEESYVILETIIRSNITT